MAEIREIGGVNPAKTISSQSVEAGRRISTRKRIAQAGEDPAGTSLSEFLRAQISGLKVETGNIQKLISSNQVENGALGTVGEMVRRVRDLSLRASTSSLTSANRQHVQQEIEGLRLGINRITRDARFDAQPVIAELGTDKLSGINVGSDAGAQEAVVASDDLLEEISSRRGALDAEANRLQDRIQSLSSERFNTTPAQFRLSSADVAEEASGQTQSQIRNQANTAITAQANVFPQSVLRLLE